MAKDKYVGKKLSGRYEIIDVVGIGGMAMVYRARDQVLGRYVAVKILKDEFAKDPDIRKRFSIESQAVAKLSHQNIVSVYDVGSENGMDYIVMELMEGITLKEYLQKKGRLSWQESVFFAQQICRALVHAHSRGIIHQDIKPQNVIILRDGTAKLTDFGIASFAATQETRVVQEAIGSVHYVSPEQAKGGKIDFRTDIYSLGVVMYEMLTGKLPFTGETAIQVVMQHLNAVPLPPRDLVPDIPEGLDAIVMHAMCAQISKRYATAEELYTDLERLRNNANAHFNYGAEEDGTQVITPEVRKVRKNTNNEVRTGGNVRQTGTGGAAVRGRQEERKQEIIEREPEPEPEREGFFDRLSERPGLAAGIAVTVFAVIALLVAGLLLHTGKSSEDLVDVPSLIGQTIDEVMEDAELTEKFTIKEASQRKESDRPEGEILEQDPKDGTKVLKGAEITLTVSKGGENVKDTYKVIDLNGRTMEYAKEILGARDVMYEVFEENSETVEAGKIIRTDPSAGKELDKDSVLTIYVSIGKAAKETQVPNIVGKSQSDAESALSERGLSLGSVTPCESSEAAGTVIWQSLSEGETVTEGTAVNIQISSGSGGTQQQKPDQPLDATDNPEGTEPPEDGSNEDGNTDGEDGNTGNEEGGDGFADITVPLPDNTDMSNVQIFVDGEIQYDQTLDTSQGSATISVPGSVGEHEVTVNIDGNSSSSSYEFK